MHLFALLAFSLAWVAVHPSSSENQDDGSDRLNKKPCHCKLLSLRSQRSSRVPSAAGRGAMTWFK